MDNLIADLLESPISERSRLIAHFDVSILETRKFPPKGGACGPNTITIHEHEHGFYQYTNTSFLRHDSRARFAPFSVVSQQRASRQKESSSPVWKNEHRITNTLTAVVPTTSTIHESRTRLFSDPRTRLATITAFGYPLSFCLYPSKPPLPETGHIRYTAKNFALNLCFQSNE